MEALGTSLALIVAVSAGRLVASAASICGLAGVAVAGMAMRRGTGQPRDGGDLSRPAIGAALGLVAAVGGAVVVFTADGGVGTGNGLGGGVVAMALGAIALLLAGTAGVRRGTATR
jgi:hypothetical protein